MKREDIEKAADYLGEIRTPDIRHRETVKVIIEQVNVALEEARVKISEAEHVESAMNIVDQLKIK